MIAACSRRVLALGIAALVSCLAAAASAASIDTIAKQAFLLDMTTGTVLFAKNADERMQISSMSKIMTLYMVFERLKNGGLNLTDTLPVSQRAWRMGGSKMFVSLATRSRSRT